MTYSTNIQSDFECNECRHLEKENAELKKENERLREALQYVQWWIKVNNEGSAVNFDFDKIDSSLNPKQDATES